MNGHRVHAYYVLVRCDCGTVLLWQCGYSRRRRGADGMLHCVAIDTYQRRHKGRAHRCTVARGPRRARRNLPMIARTIFRDELVDKPVADALFST